MKNWKKYAALSKNLMEDNIKNRKRFFCLQTLVLLSLALLAGCGSSDSDLRDTDLRDTDEIIDEYDFGGTLARNRELLQIVVGHDQEAIYIYSEDPSYELNLLDKVELPTYELHDTDWDIEWVDTSNFAGDYNGDLRVTLRHADYSTSYIVWTWEKDKGYVYQPDDSRFYDSGVIDEPDEYHVAVEGRWLCDTVDPYYCIEFDAEGNWKIYTIDIDSDVVDVADEGYLCYVPEEDVTYLYSNVGGDLDGSYIEVDADWLYISTGDLFIYDRFAPYEGLWRCEKTDRCYYLQFDAYGNWQLWLNGDVIDEGYLWYCEEQGQAIYICSTLGRFMNGGGIGLDGDRLYISTNGDLDFCFDYLDGRGGHWQDADGSSWDDEYREDSELYHRDISEFEGTWYYNNDFWAPRYIMIDGDGHWSFYEYIEGPEATEIDCGTFSCSTEETAVYYANSTMDDGVNYRVFELEEGIIIWDDKYEFYRIDW